MIDLVPLEAICRDMPNVLLAAPLLIGLLLLGCAHIHRRYRQHEQAIAAEMRRLMRVYVTAGRWTPQDTAVGRQAEAALKARVIIK